MLDLLETAAAVLARMAPFLLLGFGIAGLLHAWVPRRWLVRAVGGEGLAPIVRGALVGIPLPLCSCGVIPVAVELRKRGGGRGATTSFLIATPETGVDSIAASAAVLHPLLVVFRPLAALVTAVATGLAVEHWTAAPAARADVDGSCCHGEDEIDQGPRGIRAGLRYAFVDLFGEVARYLVPAIVLTAIMTVWLEVPARVAETMPHGWQQMLLLLVLGIPVYVCAAAATPVAAALIVAGFSPGAALVFLLAGPATNIVTITTAAKTLGRGAAALYAVSIAVCSLAFGLALDGLYAALDVPAAAATGQFHEHLGPLQLGAAVALGALIVWHAARGLRRRLRR